MSAPNTPASAATKSTPSFANFSDMFNLTFDTKPGGLYGKMYRGTASAPEQKEFLNILSELHGMFEAMSALPISPGESTGGKVKREMLRTVGDKVWFVMVKVANNLGAGHDDVLIERLVDTVEVMRKILALIAYTESLEAKLGEASRQLEEATRAKATSALAKTMAEWDRVDATGR